MVNNKGKEICRVCGNEDYYVIWSETVNNTTTENEFFLCHKCGFFCRKYENGEVIEGITLDPKIVPLKSQLTKLRKAIKRNRGSVEGLVITDHFPYKPKKAQLLQ